MVRDISIKLSILVAVVGLISGPPLVIFFAVAFIWTSYPLAIAISLFSFAVYTTGIHIWYRRENGK